jgi:hypothetical protein
LIDFPRNGEYVLAVAEGFKNSTHLYLWDYDSTLFPLGMNRLMVERFSTKLRDFVQTEILSNDGGFQSQHRVFATKRGWFLRPTVKLDPVAEFFIYDFAYRNRALFRDAPAPNRRVYGFRIVNGEPISILRSYIEFKRAVALHRAKYQSYAYFDIAAYFNHIYHHDLVRWFEDAGGGDEDTKVFGKFLREIAAGRSIDCLPQGIYPSKMIGSAFLGFLENSSRIRAAQSLRLMDDMWLFDDQQETLISDFLIIQSLLIDRGLSINDRKSAILEGHDADSNLPSELDKIKIQLLRKRREELREADFYGDLSEESESGISTEIEALTDEEQDYLLSLLRRDNIQEEDAELVLTLMRDSSADVLEFIPTLVREFPGLSKRLYHFCSEVEDKGAVTAALNEYLGTGVQVTEYQLFWFGKMAEDYLLKSRAVGELLFGLYEHSAATDISKAKILEIPEKRFGLPELREEQLRTGHSGWLAWSAAVGARVHPKGQRNQLLKYFRKASSMNRLIGEFVEACF